MGNWRVDQHKKARRYVWGQTRGHNEEEWQDFARRAKAYPVLGTLRIEKLGQEIHLWRETLEEGGSTYWMSCLRFVDDGYGYWTVFYRPDEGRWRSAEIKEQPLGRALEAAAAWYKNKLQ